MKRSKLFRKVEKLEKEHYQGIWSTFMSPDFNSPISPEHLLTSQPRMTAKEHQKNIMYGNICQMTLMSAI